MAFLVRVTPTRLRYVTEKDEPTIMITITKMAPSWAPNYYRPVSLNIVALSRVVERKKKKEERYLMRYHQTIIHRNADIYYNCRFEYQLGRKTYALN